MICNNDGKPMNDTPHEGEFRDWRSRISDADYQAMEDAINAYVDGQRKSFCTSGMPRESAIDEAFPPLRAACRGSDEQSVMFFGNIVWRVLMERDDEWHFLPADRESDHMRGAIYFRRSD